MNSRTVIIILLFVFFTARGQESFTIEGEVLDETGTPIAVGDVLVLQSENQELLKYTTLLEGKFNLEAIPKGNYILRISG